MDTRAHQEAENFLRNETQFHLGMLPTEQSNPKTNGLDLKFADNPVDGVKMLLSVDREIYSLAQIFFRGMEFKEIVKAGIKAVSEGKKIVFSGCGATGRLSILLESMWRCFFREIDHKYPAIYNKTKKYENSVFSIMTGGDYALIRAVEYFEDYHAFGRQQAKEMNIEMGDVLIAITEGGETSSVLGTVAEAADRGAKVFLVFNNPADILAKYIKRSKIAIEDPRVTVVDLYCGPMAIAGSTRMQATTSEQLIAGAVLESILSDLFKKELSDNEIKTLNIRDIDYAQEFITMLDELLMDPNTDTLAEYIKMEKSIYQENGLVTYFGKEFLLDIFTDSTERAPTFMLPPFKKADDPVSPPSWAFIKNPLLPTPETWNYVLGRQPRCLDWTSKLYRQMGVPESLASAPPILNREQIIKFHIGNEDDNSRLSRKPNIAINILGKRDIESPFYNDYINSFEHITSKYQHKSSLIIGKCDVASEYKILCSPVSSILNLMERLAVKLILNTISTGTMVMMGRVSGNWMTWVDVTNKKLKDRGIRLISDICGLSYHDACYALHETIEELKTINLVSKEKFSPVQYTIKKYVKQG
jgi:N-acetylmuramic acid 6-phosphate etherase